MKERPSYADLPPEFSSRKAARIAVVPVPYDGTSTWRKGADRGPAALIEASRHLELYDIETDGEVYRNGIFTDRPVGGLSTPESMAAAVHRRVSDHLAADRFVVLVGGEHSVTVGSVKAHAEKYPDLSVLQLDAHADLRPEYRGSRLNHACVMARVREICPAVQVGIRSMDASERPRLRCDRTFLAADIADPDSRSGWMRKAIDGLTDRVYLTVDLDVFDPSVMPSTGTPEPGGLSWYTVLRLLRLLTEKKTLVGFDVVELCPPERPGAPEFLAAKLVYKILGYRFGKAGANGRD